MTGTEKVIGILMKTQRPLNELYLNEGVAWADEAAVLAGIPSVSRSDGLKVRIGLVDYEFMADLATLQAVSYANDQTASEVPIVDAGDLFDAANVEDALAEVKSQVNATDAAIAALGSGTLQTTFSIRLGAYSTVSARVATATVTTDYPTGWTIEANSTVNLLVTHNLTVRKVSSVNVWEIDGANERLLKPFEAAYSGCLVNLATCLIEGLAPTTLAIRIEITIP
jgi:hypothetical protein